MPIFGKSKSAKYDYYLLLHNLSPFPANHKSIYIAWQRGSGKHGQTRAVGPTSTGPGRSWATYQFEEALHVDCTLNQDPKAQGTYEKKWLILAVMDSERGSSKDPLGRVVINLADYAADDDRATMSFTVAASKAISGDIGECKMLITLGCRSKGKPPMQLGGEQSFPNIGPEKGSTASSDDEEDDDDTLHFASASQPAANPRRNAGQIPSSDHHRNDVYDADGILVDDDMEEQVPGRRASGAAQPTKGASSDDSEDEFLAQAVAAMEAKAPIPVAKPSRQTRREAPKEPAVTQIPSIGRTVPPIASTKATRQREVLPTPYEPEPNLAAVYRPGGSIFALKPEGSGREADSALPEKPKTSSSESITPPYMTRPPKADGELLSSRRSSGGAEPSPATFRRQGRDADSLAGKPSRSVSRREEPLEPATSASSSRDPSARRDGGGKSNRGVSTLVSQFEISDTGPLPTATTAVSRRSTGLSSQDSLTAGQFGSRSSGGLSGVPVTGQEASSRRMQREPTFGEEQLDAIVDERPERSPTRRRLVSEDQDRGSKRVDSPRRRNLEASRHESPPERKEGSRGKAVVLPTGSVSIRKRPIVSAPVDDSPSPESPVVTSTPGRHWLDEPEDLGVEPSPPPSRSSSPTRLVPAYQAVAPASMAKLAGHQEREERGLDRGVLYSETSGSASPAASSRDLGSPRNNPFLNSNTGSHAPERPVDHVSIQAFPSPATSSASRQAPFQQEELQGEPSLQFAARVPQPAPKAAQQPPARTPPEPQTALLAEPYPRSSQKPAEHFPPQSTAESFATARGADPSFSQEPGGGFNAPKPADSHSVSPQNGGLYSTGALSSAQTNGGDHAQIMETYTRELRAVAALEASVYLAQSGKSRGVRASSKARNVHAPARRLARTTISLGMEEGTIFGLRAIRAIEAAADASGDIEGRAYWWSNCIQLRWMLWAMCHGGSAADGADADPDSDEFEWVMQVLVPPLRELESHIFQQLFQHMWSFILMEGVNADQLPGAQPKHWIIPPSREEEAIQRWIDGFQTVHRALLPAARSVTAGHVTLLKHKTLTALMQRLDSAMFRRLVSGDDSAGTMQQDAFSAAWKTPKVPGFSTDLPADTRVLPFVPGGLLSFGVGVNLKMAATRWTNWAADIGLRNDKGSPEEGYLLFPKLRATADLLMMPKEVLTDRAIRSEVVPGLPLRLICELLSRFQADDLARDPLPPGLLEALQNETPPSQDSPDPISQGLAAYDPPSEAALLSDGLIEPVSLEMDDESEEELESLVEMYDPDRQGHTTERFHLLRELWASAR